MNPFQKVMEFIAKWEWRNRADGFPTEDPQDPGGYTKFGISQRANPDIDVRNLTLPGAFDLYYKRYWQPLLLEGKPWQYALVAFNISVMSGQGRARKFMAETKDWRELAEKHTSFLLSLQNERYEKGWINRINDMKKYIDIREQEDGMA